MKRHHTARFKAQVLQELLKEDKTIAQIAAAYEVHPTQLRGWKAIVLEGSHFTSPQYRQLLQAAGVQISMDGKVRALDNIFTERLWRTIKYEEVYLYDYASPKEARQQLQDYLQSYNHQRLVQALDYRPPASVYFR